MANQCATTHEARPAMMAAMFYEGFLYFSSGARDGYGYAYRAANAPSQVQTALNALGLPHKSGSCAETMTTALYWQFNPRSPATLPGAVMATHGQRNGGTSFGASTPCSGDGVTISGCMEYLAHLGITCEGRDGYGKRARSNPFVCPRVPIAAKQPAKVFTH